MRRAVISAIVLAGGASRRMGTPKALLPIGETTFLGHIVGTLRAAGVSDVVVVLGADAAKIRPTMGWFDGTIAENAEWEKGQLSSVHAGLDALGEREREGAIIWPVDHPAITQELIVDMIRAFQDSGKGIVLPVHEGRKGHPVLFSSKIFPLLKSASLREGAREVIRSHPEEIQDVATSDPGILRNIDTPEEYHRFTPALCAR